MNVVNRVRHRFAEQIITLLLADLKEHGVALDGLPAVRRPGDDWRDAASLAKLPSDAARDAALQVADALDELHGANPSESQIVSDGLCVWCGRERAEHGPDRLCPGTTSSFYTTEKRVPCGHRHGRYGCTMTWCGYGVPTEERQVRERWHQIFETWHSRRDRGLQEMRLEQAPINARMMMGVCLMEVFLELDNAGLDSSAKKSFSLVIQSPDGTAALNSMFDAVPFLQDLKTLVDVPDGFNAKKVAENVSRLGDVSSLRTLGLLGPLCQDQIQEMLGLPRDPDTVEAVESLLLLRNRSAEGE